MLDALKTVLGKCTKILPPESVDVFCYSKTYAVSCNMVYQLLAECIDLRLKPIEPEKRRRFKAYIRLANKMFGLFFERRGVSVQMLENSVRFLS